MGKSVTFIGASWLAVTWSACLFAQAQKPGDLLVLGTPTLDPDKSTVRVQMTNQGTKTITAYAIESSFFPNNPMKEDFFPSVGLEGESIQGENYLGGIRPGQSKEYVLPRQTQVPALTITAVVFADRTAIGDDEVIAKIFKERSAASAELQRWCNAITSTVSQADADALAARVVDASIAETDPIRKSAAQLARADLVSVLKQHGPAGQLASMVSILQKHCSAASVHAVRRNTR